MLSQGELPAQPALHDLLLNSPFFILIAYKLQPACHSIPSFYSWNECRKFFTSPPMTSSTTPRVFLTGVTGFVGGSVLSSLYKAHPDISHHSFDP